MPKSGIVCGVPRVLLRAEGLALAALAIVLYARLGVSWWLFAVLILAPDLSFLGYLAGPRAGSIAYNTVHTLVGPLLLGLAALLMAQPDVQAVALIWIAHIGLDRLLGYGLKYGAGFGFTHLGHIGRLGASPAEEISEGG